MKKRTNIIIISLVIILIIIVVFLFIRMNTNSSTILSCVKDITNNHETITLRYDVEGNLYSYNKITKLYNLDTNTLNGYYETYNAEYEKYKDQLNDNFKYEIIKNDNNMNVNVYITVSVYSSFFNQYSENIKSTTKLDEAKKYLLENNYKCSIRKKYYEEYLFNKI